MDYFPVTLREEPTTARRSAPPSDTDGALPSPAFSQVSTVMFSAGTSVFRSPTRSRAFFAGLLVVFIPSAM